MAKKVNFELSGAAYNVVPDSAYEIQIAPLMRRFIAFLLDVTLFVLLALGIGKIITTPLIESAFNYSQYTQQLNEKIYEFGFSRIDGVSGDYVLIDFSLEGEDLVLEGLIQTHGPDLVAAQLGEYDTDTSLYVLTGDLTDKVRKLETLFYSKEDVMAIARSKSLLNFANSGFSSFLAQLLIFLFIPLLLKNGRTLGMLLFRVGLVGANGLRLKTTSLLIRFFLGLFVIETLGTIFLFSLSEVLGIVYIIILLGAVISLPKNKAIHDVIGRTVVVDMDAQYIIDTFEEKVEAQKQEYKQFTAGEKMKKKR